MRNVTLATLVATAIGAISIGSASAMPFSVLPTMGESHVQGVRVVCDRYGRCYNTRRVYRSARAPRAYYGGPYYAEPGYSYPGYYAAPGYGYPGYYARGYGYYGGPRVGIGIGPFGFGIW